MNRVATHRTCAAALVLVLALVAGGCGSVEGTGDDVVETTAPARSDAAAVPEPPADADAPLADVVGDLVMTKLVGPVASVDELTAIGSLQLGGVILFGPNVQDSAQLRALTASLRRARLTTASAADRPAELLISVDQEGGAIRNVPFAPPERTQPELAAGSVDAARAAARATAVALRAAGVNIDLGPVADLRQEPNHTMAGRAFGSDPKLTSPFVAASVAGLQSGGVAATAKHFPGFGASSANSDEAVAYVDRSRAELLQTELAPFRAAIDAGTELVMVSHGVYRSLGSRLPGTLDPRIATDLLRAELGFEGVAMTDSMNARGLREAWGDTVPRACPQAIRAGIDLVLLTGSLETARLCRQRILDAVEDGSLSETRVRAAVARVDRLRAHLAAGRVGLG